jgi:hypothetical protein
MDSLHDLLGKYSPKEPAEILAIKRYIQEQFNAPSSVTLQGETAIVITVHSASLANTLRYHVPKLRKVCDNTTKRFLFRIG